MINSLKNQILIDGLEYCNWNRDILEDDSSFPCTCLNSDFKDSFCGHIVSGDLTLIKNNKL